MRKKIIKIISFILIIAICITSTAMATTRASDYIFSYSAYSTGGNGTGTVVVNFSITGMRKMTSIGATKIEIKNTSGIVVDTFEYTDIGYTNMMGYNRSTYLNSITFNGTPNTDYYAVVYFLAANSSGSDTADYTTGVVTA